MNNGKPEARLQSGESEEAASGSRSHSHCSTLSSIETAPGQARAGRALGDENQLNMGKGDPKKPRGKMSSYAFFVQTCREEHKKKHPDASVNFSEFSKKCSERWKTMSAKEKGKFEDMAKADRACYEKEMKTYIPLKGRPKRSSRTSMHPRDLLRPSSCSVLSITPKSKDNTLAYPLVMLQRN